MNHEFFSEGSGASNGDSSSAKVCVDRKVHITLESSWYDQSGDSASASDHVFYGCVTPCDGSCLPTRELPKEAEELVQRFLRSNGEDRGEYRLDTRRHPDALPNLNDWGEGASSSEGADSSQGDEDDD